jgi:branched-chain amino acid transport system ATP-binding protein
MSDLLALDTVSVAYGKRRALENVSLTIGAGEIVTLLGANGSGKSTTLRAISGLVRSHTGRIVLDGRDITRAAPDAIVAAGVGHVPEGREIFPQFTVHENLLVGGHTVPRAGIAEATERAFALFPILRERARQPAGTLSGGEQQMLAIARALMIRPRLLLLDEPSLGLAPIVIDLVFETLAQLRSEGTTILLVEQNAMRTAELADRSYVLRTGRVVLSGSREELLATDNFESAYLGI